MGGKDIQSSACITVSKNLTRKDVVANLSWDVAVRKCKGYNMKILANILNCQQVFSIKRIVLYKTFFRCG